MPGKTTRIMLKALNVKIVKLLDKLDVQTNLQERVNYLEEIIVKFEEKLTVKDMDDKEDIVEDMTVKEDIDNDTNSKKNICKEANDEENIVEQTNDKDDISKTKDKLDEPKSLAIQEINRKTCSKLIICELCGKVFDKNCDLENHIIESHEDHQTFECEKCWKIFVTEWRLDKHRKIHDRKTKKYCYHFNTGKSCPFEKLGCKFLHLFPDSQEKRTSLTLTESLGSFYTSTPRKPYEDCDECMESIECTDCIVKDMLGHHTCAKLMFC